MADLAIVGVQTRYWLKATFRTPRVVVFSLAFPVILLVMFNSIFTEASDTTRLTGDIVVGAHAYFTAGMLAYAITLSAFTSLLITLTTQRESGELKRYRGTPMPAWTFIASFTLRSVVLVSGVSAALIAVAHFAYDVPISASGGAEIALYIGLGTAALCALGIGFTALVDTADAASAAGPFIAVMLSFVSGIFVPVDQLPAWLEHLGRAFPLYHLADGLQRALAIGGSAGLSANDVTALCIWGAVGTLLAVRRFKWEPQSGRS